MQERFTRNPSVEIAPMKDETVLFNPANNKFCVLNRTAAFVWHKLEEPMTPEELAALLVRHFDGVHLPQALHDVKLTLAELRQIECILGGYPSQSTVLGAEHES